MPGRFELDDFQGLFQPKAFYEPARVLLPTGTNLTENQCPALQEENILLESLSSGMLACKTFSAQHNN